MPTKDWSPSVKAKPKIKKMIKNKKAKWIVRILLLVGTVISLFFVPWILVKAWILPLPDTIQEQVDEAIGHGFDGMIVYVDQAGKPPEFYTGGWKDRENKIPADPKSLFKIASISKLYSAVAATKLVKEKRLAFDKTLADYLPELKGRIENAEEITLKMMVQHRSGIPNFTDNPTYWENEQENGKNALDFALDLAASFKPDKGYEYSNTNYLLLRRIMDDVLGYNHHEYIKEKILIPLELKNTFFSITEVDLDDVMSGYYVGHDEDFKANEYGMLATAEDVGTFLRALNDGSVFDEGEQEIYPYEYNHGGLVIGYQSLAEYHKDIDAVVVQFINTTDFNGYEWNLSEIIINRIVKIIRKKKYRMCVPGMGIFLFIRR
jgi:D-alanyl-D-alanine carboxypeptidase